jgi:replicative DNA helicase
LQKVPHERQSDNEGEQVTRVTEALKDLAMSRQLTVLAVVAATSEGMTATRMRLHHLRGSTALAYDSDLVLVLDEKINAVSKVHLMYDPVRAATFQDQVLLTIEKNRSGPAHTDLEFRKDLVHYRFDPRGGFVGERLVDERVNTV